MLFEPCINYNRLAAFDRLRKEHAACCMRLQQAFWFKIHQRPRARITYPPS